MSDGDRDRHDGGERRAVGESLASCGRRCTSPGTMRIPPPTPNKPARKPASRPTTAIGAQRGVVAADGGDGGGRVELLIVVSVGGPERRAQRTKQAAQWPGAFSSNGGVSRRQTSWTSGQRVWKRQPGGGSIGLGISPCSTMRCRARCSGGSGIGTLDSSASVYGWQRMPRRPRRSRRARPACRRRGWRCGGRCGGRRTGRGR